MSTFVAPDLVLTIFERRMPVSVTIELCCPEKRNPSEPEESAMVNLVGRPSLSRPAKV
jgi:hypothetical protein